MDVFEENGTWQGTGLLSAQSKIRVRIVTHNSNDRVDEGFWRRKLTWAWAHRETTMSFNDVVLAYNNAIKTFPGNIVAGSKFQPRQGFLVTEESVRQAPSVKF